MKKAKQERLSIFSYFGGKARFCREIAELLDYDHTDIYIEPFGGAASVLLNKPTHGTEIYSDVSRGLVALMSYLSDPDKAPELIDSLYDTVYTIDCFNECLEYRNSVDDGILNPDQNKEIRMLKPFFKRFVKRLKEKDKKANTKHWEEIVRLLNPKTEEERDNERLWEYIRELMDDPTLFTSADKKLFQKYKDIGDEPKEKNIERVLLEADSFDLNENIERIDSKFIEAPDPLKLAVATYVVYSMSRDGMGTAFSSSKFHSSEAYYKQIDRLYRVAERLNGVQVIGSVGALSYLLNNSYLNEERAMFYIDAPYLSVDEDEKNLGICYKGQMELSDHKVLLRRIRESKAKFLISNYDTPVYNEYLGDWTKVTIDTVTGVGGKKNNKRTECLWYNY